MHVKILQNFQRKQKREVFTLRGFCVGLIQKSLGSRLIFDLEKLVENQEYKSCVYTTVISTCTKLNDELRDILNSSKVQLQ